MADIETRLFRYFVMLADEQHFGRAAARLEISPPTLTHQIQKLESQVGIKLASRRGNTHVEITESGKRFLQHARNVLREAEEAKAITRQAARGEIGRIEIGFMTIAILAGLSDKFVGGFRRANPKIETFLRQIVMAEQINLILNRDLDLGFMRPPLRYPAGLQGFVVYRESVLLALPGDHPLVRQKRVAPSALKDEPFINATPSLDAVFLKQTDEIGKLGNFTPKVVRRIKDMVSILSYVSAGEGVAVVARPFTKMEVPNVVYREFATNSVPTTSIALVHRNNESSPATNAFIKFVRRNAVVPKS